MNAEASNQIECPNCEYDGSPPENDPIGGGFEINHSISGDVRGLVEIEEWRCPVCRAVVYRDETRGGGHE